MHLSVRVWIDVSAKVPNIRIDLFKWIKRQSEPFVYFVQRAAAAAGKAWTGVGVAASVFKAPVEALAWMQISGLIFISILVAWAAVQ